MKLRNNESGVVLLVVIVLTVAISIISISMMSSQVSQAISNRRQIDQIKADQLTKGAFFRRYSELANNQPATLPPDPVLDGKTFDITITDGAPGGGISGTTQYTVDVTW